MTHSTARRLRAVACVSTIASNSLPSTRHSRGASQPAHSADSTTRVSGSHGKCGGDAGASGGRGGRGGDAGGAGGEGGVGGEAGGIGDAGGDGGSDGGARGTGGDGQGGGVAGGRVGSGGAIGGRGADGGLGGVGSTAPLMVTTRPVPPTATTSRESAPHATCRSDRLKRSSYAYSPARHVAIGCSPCELSSNRLFHPLAPNHPPVDGCRHSGRASVRCAGDPPGHSERCAGLRGVGVVSTHPSWPEPMSTTKLKSVSARAYGPAASSFQSTVASRRAAASTDSLGLPSPTARASGMAAHASPGERRGPAWLACSSWTPVYAMSVSPSSMLASSSLRREAFGENCRYPAGVCRLEADGQWSGLHARRVGPTGDTGEVVSILVRLRQRYDLSA